ncbi:MAG: HNH endonuclease [Acidobacteria bacterium]|nr:HNH endonuclease [Acidobacteriota bacterium]
MVTQVVIRMRRSVAELAKYGIDAEAVFAEMDAALAEQTQTFLGNLREDVALILLGGIPESCFETCKFCGERKSTLTEFQFHHDRLGRRVRNTTCKPCVAEQHQQYIDRDKEIRSLRRRLAVIEKPSVTCIRCSQKKPPTAFPLKGRTCLFCRVEILETSNQSLRDRFACQPDGPRVDVRRRQARGEYAGKRLQQAINQSDGTLTVEFLGRMFAEAEGKPCPYCGEYMNRRTKSLDHMVPLNKGGLHGTVNVIICCSRCNSAKRDRSFDDWVSRLQEPYTSVMIAEYEQRYGSASSQSLLPIQYVPVSKPLGIQ